MPACGDLRLVGHARQVSYDRLWERLLDYLDGWSTATEVEPGRVEVAMENSNAPYRVVEILMTPHEWDDMVTIPWGDFDSAAQEVQKAVLRLPSQERFLIYRDYELVPSATPSLPPAPEEARLDQLAGEHPETLGRWVVTDRDGNERDEPGPPPH